MDIIEFNRWFLALFFASVALFYAVRVTFLAKKTQETVTPIGPRGSLHFYVHIIFRVFRVAILLLCWLRLISPETDNSIGIIASLWTAPVMIVGDVLMLAAMAGIIAINFFMSDRWRSGIPEKAPKELITSGPYRYSRNPMMLFVMVAQLGFFLALPSLFSLVCLVVGVTSVFIQESLERKALSDAFGDLYREYCAQTPRWLLLR
ncbi:MAG: isoprenylcysteine carboxylmethyltransferase family protein [Kordiimonadaceae bacterium]|nr:isoprenylcysteine carboxylmethyltransferase family protein [Kordiimonadaceae bacterium]MBO6568259.1 isoprenylcysteine carboxylmethyltransferase family protein [Kordiimonadaceae bacterium]MBO6964011.1 isoprenylcysteine carboxylmethyltransferase family protein [Kordiimonadaceae bacterium]